MGDDDDLVEVSSSKDLDDKSKTTDIFLKRAWGVALLILLLVLVAFTEWLFFEYLKNNRWKVPGPTVDIWLGSTIVQIVGVVLVVVHYLFPNRDGKAV